jgi:hypothetical protein
VEKIDSLLYLQPLFSLVEKSASDRMERTCVAAAIDAHRTEAAPELPGKNTILIIELSNLISVESYFTSFICHQFIV